MAVAHNLIVIVYHVLKTQQPYRDLGKDYFTHLAQDAIKRRALRQLETLGYSVELHTPMAAVS